GAGVVGGALITNGDRVLNGIGSFVKQIISSKPGSADVPGAGKDFSKKQKGEQHARAGGKCENANCGKDTLLGRNNRDSSAEGDHVIPRAEGGNNSDENLQNLCRPCNRAKGKTMPVTTSK